MIMKEKSRRFKVADALLLAFTILPLAAGVVIKVLTAYPTQGISITGAQIYFTIPMPLQSLPITEAQVNSLLVVLTLTGFCLYMTHGIRAGVTTRRQLLAEWIVEKMDGLVLENMGEFFKGFAPFVTAILGLSAISSLLSLLGLFPPTSDLNVVVGWSILVFILITHYKLKGGVAPYLKGYLEPIPVLLPLNILGEFATPLSMAFRHYGNVLSGSIIAVLISAGLQAASLLVMGALPGFLAELPIFRIGLPAVFSLYFDIFSGCMQAFIFAMLTMLNIAGGFPQDEYEKRRLKKLSKNKKIKN